MEENRPPDTALLEIDDVSGKMQADLRDQFYLVIRAALEETGRFRLLARQEVPAVGVLPPSEEPEALADALAVHSLKYAVLPRAEQSTSALTGQRSWKFSIILYELRTGRRLALRESLQSQDAPPENLRWLVYEFAEPAKYEKLAKKHRLAELAQQPEALKKDPEYLGLLLLAHLQKGSWNAAIEGARGLIGLDPNSAIAWHALALALHRTSKEEEALQAVGEAIKLNPNPESWILKGDIDALAGRNADALECYREAAELEGEEGSRAKAKLSALEYALGPERDPLLALRLGWMWGYLHYVGVMVKTDMSEELKKHVLSVASELETQFRQMSGVHLATLVGLENWNAWVRAVNASDSTAYRDASETCFGSREAVASLADVLPESLRRWLRMSRELFWIQAVFYVTAQHWDNVGTDNPPRQEEHAFKTQAGLLADDSDLAKAVPGMADLGRRMERVSQQPTSKEKLETTVGLIEEYRKLIFGDQNL